MTLQSPLAADRTVRFGAGPTPSTVRLMLPDGSSRSITAEPGGTQVSLLLRLENGTSEIRMQTTGPAAPNPPENVRDLRLRVQELRIEYPQLTAPRLARYVAAATP